MRHHLDSMVGVFQPQAQRDHQGVERCAVLVEVRQEGAQLDLECFTVDERVRGSSPKISRRGAHAKLAKGLLRRDRAQDNRPFVRHGGREHDSALSKERFMDRPSDRPFLVYLAHKAIHPNVIQRDDGSLVPIPGQPGGFVAADRHRGRYLGRTMPRRVSAFKPPLGKPALLRQIDQLPPLGPKTATSDDEIRGRLEMLLGVDDSLGRILAALERKGVLNDTMVVLTSDHGYFYGEHGLNEERRLAYEETIRIPLVIRYPPLAMAGSTPPEMALSLDIAHAPRGGRATACG
jgi:Sulfatase